MLMLTTTAIDIDEELLNRCLVLSINESRSQTEAIHQLQRRKQTLDGLLAHQDKTALTGLHQAIQRQLQPYAVVNPFAEQLTFLSDKTRTRRDHMKYLTLIQAIALLHQKQRPVRRISHRGQMLDYLEVEPGDIALANRLCHRILGRTLDEMPPQTRRLLKLVHQYVLDRAGAEGVLPAEVRFTRRDVREATGWSDNQLKVHCGRLADMEYLIIHGGSRGHLLQYELLYGGQQDDQPQLAGLIEVANLSHDSCKLGSAPGKLGAKAGKLPPGLGQAGSKLGLGQSTETPVSQGVNGKKPSQVGVRQKTLIEPTQTPAPAGSVAGGEHGAT